VLLARLYEARPLACPICFADMRIIAFLTEGPTVRPILTPIGEPAEPPKVSPARGPPSEWDDDGAEPPDAIQAFPAFDPAVPPEPDLVFDQTVGW
jgi:hypothetical protein